MRQGWDYLSDDHVRWPYKPHSVFFIDTATEVTKGMRWNGLPEFDMPVLVCNINIDKEIEIGFYDPVSCPDTKWRCAEFMSKEVTHLMFFPEAPKDA